MSQERDGAQRDKDDPVPCAEGTWAGWGVRTALGWHHSVLAAAAGFASCLRVPRFPAMSPSPCPHAVSPSHVPLLCPPAPRPGAAAASSWLCHVPAAGAGWEAKDRACRWVSFLRLQPAGKCFAITFLRESQQLTALVLRN